MPKPKSGEESGWLEPESKGVKGAGRWGGWDFIQDTAAGHRKGISGGRRDTPPVYSHIIYKRTEHTASVGYMLADSLVSNWVGLRAARPCDVMRGDSALSRGEAWGSGQGAVGSPSQPGALPSGPLPRDG